MGTTYRGILIDRLLDNPQLVLEHATLVETRPATLEGESFRGQVLFYSIEVDEKKLWRVLQTVAETLKSPGWYFHLVNNDRLYIVMPQAILFASNDDDELKNIVNYCTTHGIHPEQLDIGKLFTDPFA